jgi:dinuclear metal center YbgI/SA1388 family protein
VRLIDIYNEIEKIAPKSLSDEYCARFGAYDNSGILVDTGEEIDNVVFSLDFSRLAIERAIEENAKLIITHHPAIYGKISEICTSDFSPLSEKIVDCIQNGIAVISMHLNLDCANGGIDESLMQGVKASAKEKTQTLKNAEIMQPLSEGGYGRAYSIATTPLSILVKNIGAEFNTERVQVYANGKEEIKKVASFCGSGADEEAVRFAMEQNADLIVSSDFKHHILSLANEKGLAVIALTHYAAENYGFYQFYKKICQSVSVECEYHTDEDLL